MHYATMLLVIEKLFNIMIIWLTLTRKFYLLNQKHEVSILT